MADTTSSGHGPSEYVIKQGTEDAIVGIHRFSIVGSTITQEKGVVFGVPSHCYNDQSLGHDKPASLYHVMHSLVHSPSFTADNCILCVTLNI